MDIGEEGEGVVEVSELFVNQDSVGVRSRVSKVPVDAYQQVLKWLFAVEGVARDRRLVRG